MQLADDSKGKPTMLEAGSLRLHVIRRGNTLLVEGREVRVFARRHPEDAARIQAVVAPAAIRERWERGTP